MAMVTFSKKINHMMEKTFCMGVFVSADCFDRMCAVTSSTGDSQNLDGFD